MRRAAWWVVVAAVGLSACTAASKTSTSTQTATPSAGATTPSDSGTPSTTASGSAATTLSPGGTTAEAGTRADYLAKAKPICEGATKVIDALPEPGSNTDEKLKILDQRAAALTEALNKLKALTPPTKDAASVKFILDHVAAVRDDTSGEAAALRAGDTVKAGQLEARFDGDENIAKNAGNDYGLGDCGA